MRSLAALVGMTLGLLEPSVGAQAPSAALDVELRSRAVAPGEVIEVTVRTPRPAASVSATLGDQPMALWRLEPDAWRGLVGLDADQAPGPLPLAVSATTKDGARLSRTDSLDVAPATFAERHLTVAPRYVDPPESERPRIERERERLRAIYETVSTDRQPGRFAPPVPHRRSSPFGSRSIFNGQPRERHAGLDFASPAGTVVRAPAAGRVVLVDDLYFTGNTVVIDHGRGLYSILAHLQRTSVRPRQVVPRGARLGTVGATGRATAPHLHWSIRLGANRVDPAAVLEVLAAPVPDRQPSR